MHTTTINVEVQNVSVLRDKIQGIDSDSLVAPLLPLIKPTQFM